jgi:prepilin-type N-terminal cleavage/methylation domain-containing protein
MGRISPRDPAASLQAGFTLIELMVVVVLMGTVILLVPSNYGVFGARARLNETGNSMAAAFAGARQQAILDAYQVSVQIGSYRDEDSKWHTGWRYEFTSVPAVRSGVGEDRTDTEQENLRRRQEEREWLYTDWHEVPSGVQVVGVSDEKGVWHKLTDGGKPFVVRYFADGTVEKAVAIRFENEDLDVAKEYRTMTVMVNGLTSEPSVLEGEHELPEQRPASDFGN